MHVRRIAMLACVALALGGCPAQDNADHRLELNDDLRVTCWGLNDLQLQQLLALF